MAACAYRDKFSASLRKLCSEQNIVLIIDEVMSGYRAAFNGAAAFRANRA